MAALDGPTVRIAHRFRGPERSGNGGYTAGLLARRASAFLNAPVVTVTLRRPPPLDVALDLIDTPGGVELRTGDELVATATSGTFSAEVIAPVAVDAAEAAESSYRGAENHPFPNCFVCGPARQAGDGLRLAPGGVDAGRTACVWVPDASLSADLSDSGSVAAEFVWAALDCPGGWTSDLDHRPLVLGRMTAEVTALPTVGEPLVVVGELLAEDGRKTFTATSLYNGDHLLARAEHTWLAVDPALFS